MKTISICPKLGAHAYVASNKPTKTATSISLNKNFITDYGIIAVNTALVAKTSSTKALASNFQTLA